MTVPRFHWMVKLHLYSCQSHLWKYIAPLIRDIPNASLAWKLNASKCIWVSMLFNINNQTSHYWMPFVYVHFVCVLNIEGQPNMDTGIIVWTLICFTILICCFFTVFIFSWLYSFFFPHPFCQSDPAILWPEMREPNIAGRHRSPFTNWTLKVRIENHLSWETNGNQPHELPLELSLKATGESREQKSHESQQAAPHAQARGFFFGGGRVDRCFFSCGWRPKVCYFQWNLSTIRFYELFFQRFNYFFLKDVFNVHNGSLAGRLFNMFLDTKTAFQ